MPWVMNMLYTKYYKIDFLSAPVRNNFNCLLAVLKAFLIREIQIKKEIKKIWWDGKLREKMIWNNRNVFSNSWIFST